MENKITSDPTKEKIFEEFPTMIGHPPDVSFDELDSNFSVIQSSKADLEPTLVTNKNILDDILVSQPLVAEKEKLDKNDPMAFIIEGQQNNVLDFDFDADTDSSKFEPLELKSDDFMVAKPGEMALDKEGYSNICDQNYEFDDLNISAISGNDTQNDASQLDSLTDNIIDNNLDVEQPKLQTSSNTSGLTFGSSGFDISLETMIAVPFDPIVEPTKSLEEEPEANNESPMEDASASFSTFVEKSKVPEVELPEQINLSESNSEETSLETNAVLIPESLEKISEVVEAELDISEVAHVVNVENGSLQELAPIQAEHFVDESPLVKDVRKPHESIPESFESDPQPLVTRSESCDSLDNLKQMVSATMVDPLIVEAVAVSTSSPLWRTAQVQDIENVEEHIEPESSVLAAHSNDQQAFDKLGGKNALKTTSDNSSAPNLSVQQQFEDVGDDDYIHTSNISRTKEPDNIHTAPVDVEQNSKLTNLLRTSPTAAVYSENIESTKGDDDKFTSKTVEEEVDEPIKEEVIEPYSANTLEKSKPVQATVYSEPSVARLQNPTTSAVAFKPEPKIMGRKNYRRDNSGDSEADFSGTDNLKEWLQILLGACASDLLYWRDPKRTGPVFGLGLIILFALSCSSVISVLAYTLFFSLLGTLSFRVYKTVLQAVHKTDEGHPFKEYLELEINPSQERVHEIADQLLEHFNCSINKMRGVLLVEDIIESLKYLVLFWSLTYIGSWFNGLTLVILAYIAAFSLPKVYELNKTQIDQYIELVSSKISEISEKVPFLKKAAPAAEKKDD